MDYTPSEAEKRFEPKGRRWCGMTLFDVKGALEVINDCERDGITLLGIEGFTPVTRDGKEFVYSDTADILDTSYDGAKAYARSVAFVSEPRRAKLFFEFVFGDER